MIKTGALFVCVCVMVVSQCDAGCDKFMEHEYAHFRKVCVFIIDVDFNQFGSVLFFYGDPKTLMQILSPKHIAEICIFFKAAFK
jgi:hypothetical protein